MVGVILFLVFVTGGNHFWRAMRLIYTSPKENRSQMKTDLFATENQDVYGGILAGVARGKVWVWGKSGLKSFVIDQYSVYLYKDRCSDSAREKIVKGVPDDTYTMIVASLDLWQSKARQGDYVVVRIAASENGGTPGNLREIHAYNYWAFLRGDINILCAR